jgi:hypothetical protein
MGVCIATALGNRDPTSLGAEGRLFSAEDNDNDVIL